MMMMQNGKHRAPQPGDIWIVTTPASQYTVRLTRVLGQAWAGVKQEPRANQWAEFQDSWHDKLGLVVEAAGPIGNLTERLR